ncbi:hypothetical protein AKO1_000577 [Acrasis kona]|uniref:Uncharacterized protein n=1 Tax=Acrasis kona TaxID=1008807 RepID=A0AAW2ZSH0_9EUKA
MRQVFILIACAVIVLAGDPGGITANGHNPRYALGKGKGGNNGEHKDLRKFGANGPTNLELPVTDFLKDLKKSSRIGPHKINFEVLPMYSYTGPNGKMYTSCQMDCESKVHTLKSPLFDCSKGRKFYSYSIETKVTGTTCYQPTDVSRNLFMLAMNICYRINKCELTKLGKYATQKNIDNYKGFREVLVGSNELRITNGINKLAKSEQLKRLAAEIVKKTAGQNKAENLSPDPKAINDVLF